MHATLTHDFTIDELRAYAAGALAPTRTAVIAAHLDAGCLDYHSWLLNADEIGALLRSGALPVPGPPPAATWDERLRDWARRRVQPRNDSPCCSSSCPSRSSWRGSSWPRTVADGRGWGRL